MIVFPRERQKLYMKKNQIVCRTTVENVLIIPAVISPTPPPPLRRNRRKHKLRVPRSECHCPCSNDPTVPKSNDPSKYPTPPHPLVRSKSAVVRSLYKKMRTPFMRSQTVDENMLRYYSPETSEYSVSEGYIHTGQRNSPIALRVVLRRRRRTSPWTATRSIRTTIVITRGDCVVRAALRRRIAVSWATTTITWGRVRVVPR